MTEVEKSPLKRGDLKLLLWIQLINQSGKKVLAVDIPSGLNADTGDKCGAAIKADHTLTLGLPKKGLYLGQGPDLAGQVHIIDIGLPKELVRPYL